MKSFDLEAALNGEPVVTRGGHKAYIKFVIPDDYEGDYPLQGYICGPARSQSWTTDGREWVGCKSVDDIVGMWEEPPATVSINGHEFPKPCTEPLQPGQRYYAVTMNFGWFVILHDKWTPTEFDNDRLKNGVIHLTEEAAKAHAYVLNAIHSELVR